MISTTIKFSRLISLKPRLGIYEVRSMKTRGFARAVVCGHQPTDLSLSYEVSAHWEDHPIHGLQLNITSWKPHSRTTAEQIASLSRLYR